MIHIGVIGYGYWGPNLVRNFQNTKDAKVVAVCDLNPRNHARVKALYPAIETCTDGCELVKRNDIDAVVIATPVSTHFKIAMAALSHDKHVLIEKPITQTVREAQTLIDEATRRHKVLMVDHTFVYTGAVRKIRSLVDAGELGEVLYYDSVRINLGLFQHDVNVLCDLATHDIAIMSHVVPHRPTAVSATGISHIPGEPENTAFLTVFFDGNCIGHIHANWLSPVKIRHTLVGGSRRMVVYNDLDPSETVKVYDRGVNVETSRESVYEMLISYRSGDMLAPQIDRTEALQREAVHFVDCIANGTAPVSDGQAGLAVVRILEAATASMADRGRPVEL
jgi:predicted dehydrogenase